MNNVKNHPAFYGSHIKADSSSCFVALVTDIPEQKPKSVKCRLRLLGVLRNKDLTAVEGEIIAYFRNSPQNRLLMPNTVVLFNAPLTEVPPALNPGQFDYRQYLRNKQVYHVSFVAPGQFAVLPFSVRSSAIWQLGLTCKQFILSRLRNGGLSEHAYAICAALITGYDADIDRDVMQAFSHSGTLHVLSVSGLHTGLIYLLLSFVFDLFDRKKKRKLLKFLFITVCLWAFALLAGFSAPVLRAVIMFNLLGFGKIYFRSGTRHQLNILAVSAFILLNYDPHLVCDVGFLLSYFAMAGLFCFQPVFSSIWKPHDMVSNYLWQSITASCAATLSTLPITLYFFK
ncbi:MAG TPA: ComEC/Rec2 family competence protein, partial [Chitinophagaceae bacterium]|nr:ComEC/Rec2 family competence protein [Chitinophagaceae bacterium]